MVRDLQDFPVSVRKWAEDPLFLNMIVIEFVLKNIVPKFGIKGGYGPK